MLLKEKRSFGKHDWHKKTRTNVIGALIETCLLTTGLFTSSINGDIFHNWVQEDLLPKLPKNSVIVMDNATFHRRSDTQALIKEAGFIGCLKKLWVKIGSGKLARVW